MSLARLPPQNDFSAGAFRSTARELIPPNGAYTLQNLLLDEDGAAYKRGGSVNLSTAAFGTSLRWVWDGFLVGGQRTVIASPTAFGVLDAAELPISLGGAGLTSPPSYAVLGGVLYIGGGTIYAGSRKAADYSTGTIATTLGSKTVTGTGTAWLANVDAGMLLRTSGAYSVVESVGSDTQLTVTIPATSTGTGLAYTLARLGSVATSGTYRLANIYAAVGTRLLTGEGRRVYESAGMDAASVLHPAAFSVDLYHEMPAGAEVLDIRGLTDSAYVFTTAGLFIITNLPFDIFDDAGNLQQSVQHPAPDLILWGPAGIASWQDSLVVPAADAVWLIGSGAPRMISHSIQSLYVGHVRAGRRPGQSWVHNAHFFLPVLDASNVVVDLLVCRLDRPTRGDRGDLTWAWTWMRNHGGNLTALTTRVGGAGAARAPRLLGAAGGADARVLDVSGFFEPSQSNHLDADGTALTWIFEGRDRATGDTGASHTARFLRIRYQLEDSAGSPTITAYISKGAPEQTGALWGAFNWGAVNWFDTGLSEFALLAGGAPEEPSGRYPFMWSFAKWTRFVRTRLQSSDPQARMTLRSVEWFVMPNERFP